MVEELKQKEPLTVEIPKLVTVDPQLSKKIEKYFEIYERNNEKKILTQSVFRILFYNWSLNKIIRKLKSGAGKIIFNLLN